MSFGVKSILRFGDPGSGEVIFKTHGMASLPGVLIYGDGREKQQVDVQIPLDEFMEAVKYVLTNTNLSEGEWSGLPDPREEFLNWTRTLRRARGYGRRGKRLTDEDSR